MHSHEELNGVGVSGSLLLKFVRQEHPIDPDASKLVCPESGHKDDVKLVELLAKHQTKNDGFTLELLKTLGYEVVREWAKCTHSKKFSANPDSEVRPINICEPSAWSMRFCETSKQWELRFVGHNKETERRNLVPNSVLVADGTLEARLRVNACVYYEAAATLALIAGGYWKRHVDQHGIRRSKMLNYVSWAEVKQQLCDDGRPGLADLFDEFFKSCRYRTDLLTLLNAIAENSWGFDADWDQPEQPSESDYEPPSVEVVNSSIE